MDIMSNSPSRAHTHHTERDLACREMCTFGGGIVPLGRGRGEVGGGPQLRLLEDARQQLKDFLKLLGEATESNLVTHTSQRAERIMSIMTRPQMCVCEVSGCTV
jgi:hypothetical protein